MERHGRNSLFEVVFILHSPFSLLGIDVCIDIYIDVCIDVCIDMCNAKIWCIDVRKSSCIESSRIKRQMIMYMLYLLCKFVCKVSQICE